MFKVIVGILLLPLPSALKTFIYRSLLGYKVGSKVKIGFSMLVPESCSIGDRVRIGHFNFIGRMRSLSVGDDVLIGLGNVILGGNEVVLGSGVSIGRFNEINSILRPLSTTSGDPSLLVGEKSIITAWHKIDYTHRVVIGASVVLAGRLSNIWTHNRQEVHPVSIGRNCYVGSGVQFGPGSSVGDYCVVGMGAVVTKRITGEYKLIGGVPARPIKDLGEDDRVFVTFPTRPDLGTKTSGSV